MGKGPYILIHSEISRFNIYNSQAVISISPAISLIHLRAKREKRTFMYFSERASKYG